MTNYNQILKSFSDLKPDWDSYGAESIDPDAIEATQVFIEAIQNGSASVFPTPNGGCQIEVHAQGWDIEIEFDSKQKDVIGFWEKHKE
jgi:hypothetical protein